MRNFLKKLFYNRYGIDNLTSWMLIVSILLSMFYNLLHWTIFYLLSCILLLYCIFRMFSKNYTKRKQENYKWCNFINHFKHKNTKLLKRLKDFPRYRYFTCRNCGQTIRIPRGKGNIEIKCPRCGYSFRSKT